MQAAFPRCTVTLSWDQELQGPRLSGDGYDSLSEDAEEARCLRAMHSECFDGYWRETNGDSDWYFSDFRRSATSATPHGLTTARFRWLGASVSFAERIERMRREMTIA